MDDSQPRAIAGESGGETAAMVTSDHQPAAEADGLLSACVHPATGRPNRQQRSSRPLRPAAETTTSTQAEPFAGSPSGHSGLLLQVTPVPKQQCISDAPVGDKRAVFAAVSSEPENQPESVIDGAQLGRD